MREIETTGHRPTIKKRRLSKLLAQARRQCDLSQNEVSARLGVGWSRAKLARIEQCQWIRPDPRDVRDLCELYGVSTRETEALRQLAIEARTRGWWRRYDDVFINDFVGLEADASMIREYEPLYVPGLFQTPAYIIEVTRAFAFDGGEEAERRITARTERQQLLDRIDPPTPELHVVLDEAVLLRRFGTVAEQCEQVRHIIDLAERDRITVQVLPLDGGLYAGMNGAFECLDFPEPQDNPVVYIETEIDERILEEDDEVTRYSLVWEKVCDSALDPRATIAHLKNILERLE